MNLKFRKKWLVDKAKRNWFWIVSTVLVIAGMIFIPMFINENKHAIEEATKAFQNKRLKSDNNIHGISIFLPQGFKIESEEENNFIVSKGSQQYIVYINPLEKKTSKLLYRNVLDSDARFVINKTFIDKERFGFMLSENKGKKIELTIGVGGFKMTTKTTRTNITADARNMMRIVNSIEILDTK
ncbi:MAG: hypothetical protein K0R18_1354 [Bacillales bacterium]|jgi:hypothetical protein|nr:hypothetical protein [Bacillales bacterium]